MKPLTKETINALFESELKKPNPHQSNIVIALYKIAFPNWKKIKKLKGYPSVSKTTNEYLFSQFIQFDKQIHPNVLNGGCWLNKGFSTNKNLQDWIIKPCEIEV